MWPVLCPAIFGSLGWMTRHPLIKGSLQDKPGSGSDSSLWSHSMSPYLLRHHTQAMSLGGAPQNAIASSFTIVLPCIYTRLIPEVHGCWLMDIYDTLTYIPPFLCIHPRLFLHCSPPLLTSTAHWLQHWHPVFHFSHRHQCTFFNAFRSPWPAKPLCLLITQILP